MKPPEKSPTKGLALALAGTALVSTNFVTAKFGLGGFDPNTFSLVWTAGGALFSLAAVLVLCRPRELLLSRLDALLAVALGLATGSGMLLSWAGLETLDPSFQAFLFRFMPVLTVLLGTVFLRERFFALELLPLGMMVAGGLVSSLGRFELVGPGVVLTLASCLAFAIQMLLAKLMVARVNPAVIAFYRLFVGAIFVAAWVLPSGRASFHVPAEYWAVTLTGAFIGPCLSHIFTFRSYRHWELSRTAMVSATQPLFVIPLAMLFLGMTPAAAELSGGVVILAGAFWFSMIELRAPREKLP